MYEFTIVVLNRKLNKYFHNYNEINLLISSSNQLAYVQRAQLFAMAWCETHFFSSSAIFVSGSKGIQTIHTSETTVEIFFYDIHDLRMYTCTEYFVI